MSKSHESKFLIVSCNYNREKTERKEKLISSCLVIMLMIRCVCCANRDTYGHIHDHRLTDCMYVCHLCRGLSDGGRLQWEVHVRLGHCREDKNMHK